VVAVAAVGGIAYAATRDDRYVETNPTGHKPAPRLRQARRPRRGLGAGTRGSTATRSTMRAGATRRLPPLTSRIDCA
jgi:hypothetical protein